MAIRAITFNSATRLMATPDLLGMTLGAAGAGTGALVLKGTTSGAVTVNVNAAAGTWTFTLPANDGNNGDVLQTDGNGATSWAAAGGAISTPAQYYVQSNGNDGTGAVANPSKPYLTGTAAYNAGVLAGVPFVINFGVGAFQISISATFNTLCKTVLGCGVASVLTITCGTNIATNANGADGFDVAVEAIDLLLTVDTNGGSVTVDDGNSYTGGAAGNITLEGNAVISVISAVGGGDWFSISGFVTGGAAGTITLRGPFRISAGGYVVATGGTEYNGGGVGADGVVNSDDADLRGTVVTGDANFGRTSYDGGLTTSGVLTDKGGNANWT